MNSYDVGADYRQYTNSFFDTAPLAGWLRCEATEDFKIQFINKFFVNLLGYDSREELLESTGGRFAAVLYPDDLERIVSAALKIPVGEDSVFTYRVLTKADDVLWLREHCRKYLDNDGTPMLLCMCINITDVVNMEDSLGQKEKILESANAELRTSEEQLRIREERLRVSEEETKLAMEQMGKMICVYDIAKRTLTMPKAYAAQYGADTVSRDFPDSLLARGILDDASVEPFKGFCRDIIGGKKTGSFEYYIRSADGEWRWENAEFVSIFGSDQKPIKAVIAIEDITQQRKLANENALIRENERLFRTVAAHSNRIIWRYDLDTNEAHLWSSSDVDPKGRTQDNNLPESVIQRGDIFPESVDEYTELFRDMKAGKPEGSAKIHMRFVGGVPSWVDMRYSLVSDGHGNPKSAVISFLDITDEHERELAYRRYLQTVNSSSTVDVVVYFETDLTADIVEKQGGNMPLVSFPPNGCTHMQAVNYGVENLIVKEERARARDFFDRERLLDVFSKGTQSLSEDWPVYLSDVGSRWFRSEIQLIKDPYSGHTRAYTVLRDVTGEKLAELDVLKQAKTDGMTGIYNKATAEALIKQRLAEKEKRPCALLIADLDGLKFINDNLGHAEGDKAIKLMANTLKSQFRKTDIVARIGGDEFIAFLDGASKETKLRSSIASLMRKLNKIYVGDADDVPVRGSIGIAFGTIGEDNYEELFEKADRALYHVKRNGKNDYAFYTPDMEKTSYKYMGHAETSVWQSDYFEKSELDRLLYAISTIYPLVISVNLTRNSYYMLQYENFVTTSFATEGEFDDLVEDGIPTFHPDDRENFIKAFSRDNLLAAHGSGEKTVSHCGRQLADDGLYRLVRTDAIFVPGDGDVIEITLARELGSEPIEA